MASRWWRRLSPRERLGVKWAVTALALCAVGAVLRLTLG